MTEKKSRNNYSENNNEGSQDSFNDIQNSVTFKQKERHLRKKKKRAKRIRALWRFLLSAALIYLGYRFVKLPQWYLPQDAFSNKNFNVIQVVNNRLIPTDIVYDVIRDVKVPDIPIFVMSVKPLAHELYKIPIVKNVYIRRYGFPARIEIIIRERTPLAVIKYDINSKPYAFFTSDGTLVVNKNYMALAQTPDSVKILAKYNKDWTFDKIKEIEKVVKSVETYSGEKVEYIDMRNPNDVYVKIQTTSIRLGVLDSTVFERIKRIYTILPQISGVDGKIKYIDLSWDKVNYLKMNK